MPSTSPKADSAKTPKKTGKEAGQASTATPMPKTAPKKAAPKRPTGY